MNEAGTSKDTMMKTLTAFSWGYWGWGTTVEKFLDAAEAHEAAAGFDAPAFADVRLRREVRAKQFSGNALEKIVGDDRYRWFHGLGNAKIATHGKGIEILRLGDVELLLEYIVGQAKHRRRVIFFCACEFIEAAGKVCCHRRIVADLLLKAAALQDRHLEVVEWPGGEVQTVELSLKRGQRVDPKILWIPLGKTLPPDGVATLPWGSTLYILKGKELVDFFLTGPAHFRGGQWKLPIGETPSSFDVNDKWQPAIQAETFRERIGVSARRSWG
jgi:hypothetical protein